MHFCIILFSIFLLSLHSAVLAALRKQNAANDIEVYRMDSFPKEKVAMHMPCEESNMFATKCMCHLRCTDQNCGNAIALCQKYRRFDLRFTLLMPFLTPQSVKAVDMCCFEDLKNELQH